MQEKLKKKAELYDSFAESREKALAKWAYTDPLWRAGRLIDVLMALNASQYVEIGCGAGLLAERFFYDWPVTSLPYKSPYIGLDISTGMLNLTREVDYDPVVCAAAEQLPFADQSIECVVGDCTIQACVEREQAMEELKRVAKKWLVVSWFKRERIGKLMMKSLAHSVFQIKEIHSYVLKDSPIINYQVFVARRIYDSSSSRTRKKDKSGLL